MKVIGITGGIGSGKSQVLSYLNNEFGASICQADEAAKELQKKGQPVYLNIVKHFGEAILRKDGELDRRKLGDIVFSNEQELIFLNNLIHPKVKCYIQEQIETARQNKSNLFVLEAALLIEDHYETICDEMWYIHTDEMLRRERLKASRGYTDSQMDAIMASQMSETVFVEHCDIVIENGSDFCNTQLQIEEHLEKHLQVKKVGKKHEIM